MPDSRFFTTLEPLTVSEIASFAHGELASGDGTALVRRVAAIQEQDLSGALLFCNDAEAVAALGDKLFGACLTTPALADGAPNTGAIIAVASPRLAFAQAAARLHHSLETSERVPVSAFSDTAIDSSVIIAAGVEISRGAHVGAQVYLGPGVVIGEDTVIEPGVSITHSVIGRNVHILAGARLGQAGFGFVEGGDGLVRVPQLGRVVIDDDVEIGANTTIDRGALADTVIGQGTKIDNLVQIGHNVRVGRYCIVAAQTGISGSCVIGDGVMMGGQVGLADHLNIGDGAQIAAGSGLMRDVPAGETWGGAPARPIKNWLREIATLSKLARKKNG